VWRAYRASGFHTARAVLGLTPDDDGIMDGMLASLDKAGRVVIPKEARDQLGLGPEVQFEVTLTGDGLLLTPLRRSARRIVEIDGWPVIEAVRGVTTTDADVQRWRDDGQR
jgi:AbrB family looped-hinge helix DNA binding protein